MFDQYLELGGVEIANAARVAAYVDKNAPQIPIPARARARLGDSSVAVAVGDAEYESPAVDGAPWYDVTEPSTAQFYGVWPLAVQGIDDSTLQATSTESVGIGGSVGAQRFASRAIRVRALLVAENGLALASGQSWLEAALKTTECVDHGGGCNGASLCFFAAEPVVCRAYEPTYQAGFTLPVSADVQTSPLLISEPLIDAIYQANLLDQSTMPKDGVILDWGTVDRNNTLDVIEQYGPVVLQRSNFIPNPRFAVNFNTWVVRDIHTRFPAGGMDGGSFAHIDTDHAAKPADIWSPKLNSASERATFGFDLRGDLDQTVTVTIWSSGVDGLPDAVLETFDFNISTVWRRYSFSTQHANGVFVKFLSDDPYDLGRTSMEAGTTPMPYFDGSTPWEDAAAGYIVSPSRMETPQYEVVWMGVANASVSRLTWLGQMTVGIPFGIGQTLAGACDSFAFINVRQGAITGWATYGLRLPVTSEQQVRPFERTMHEVTCVEGPRVIENVALGDSGGAMRIVDFTLVAGKPFAYSAADILQHPVRMSDLDTIIWPGVDACETVEIPPIIDPDCIAPPSPPRAPTIPATCIIEEPVLQRYWIEVPSASVSLWKQTVTRIMIQSGQQPIRQVRVRAFPNPFDRIANPWSRKNLMPNPRAIATGTAWTSNPGISGVAALEYVVGNNFGGMAGIPSDLTTAARLTWSTAPTGQGASVSSTTPIGSVEPGKNYTASAWFGYDRALPPVLGANIRFALHFLDGAGSVVGLIFGSTLTLGAPGSDWIGSAEVTGIAPATATHASIYVDYVGEGSDTLRPQVGDQLWVTGALMQEVPQDRDVVLTKDGAGEAKPVWQMDFGNLPAGTFMDNVAVSADLSGNAVLQFSPTATEEAGIAFTALDALTPGRAYALVLNGLTPDGAPSDSTLEINQTVSAAYDPLNPFADRIGGVAVATGVNGNYSIFIRSTVAESYRVYGVRIYEVEYTEGYFDGTTPDGNGQYYSWLGDENASDSLAIGGLPVDPCSWCSEFIISYLPPSTELVVDAILERATANVSGAGDQSADTLLYASDGGPMTWTSLTCGISYYIAIDVPEPLLDDVSISIEAAKAG